MPSRPSLVRLSREVLSRPVIRQVREISGQDPTSCSQCGKCSAGCPAVAMMDLLPSQVVRALQLGLDDAFHSRTIWLCASCLTCAARCPNGIDLARLMEAARAIVLRQGFSPIGIEALAEAAAADFPQQAVVSAFRKFVP